MDLELVEKALTGFGIRGEHIWTISIDGDSAKFNYVINRGHALVVKC
jgi:hypothetical protein